MPFVNATIRQNECLAGEEPVFENYFAGTRMGCYVQLLNKVVEIPFFNATIQGNYDCTPVKPINKTIQSNYNGYNICGFRNGDIFMNATRPDYYT